jgi:hypothetical protein
MELEKLISTIEIAMARGASIEEAVAALLADPAIREAVLNPMMTDYLSRAVETKLHAQDVDQREADYLGCTVEELPARRAEIDARVRPAQVWPF